MSGSDHTACKGIIPFALTYRDVHPWKHHHGGTKAGPGDAYQESFVDWLWTMPRVSRGCSSHHGADTGTNANWTFLLTGSTCDSGWQRLSALSLGFGKEILHRGSPGCLLLKLPPLQQFGFVSHSPPVQSSGRAPGKLHGTVLFRNSTGTKNSTWI